jgi:hypothetical protein
MPVLGALRDPAGGLLFTEEEVHQAAGVLDTNSFEWRALDPEGRVARLARMIYPRAALLNNSCAPSCTRAIDSQGRLTVHTARFI